MLGAVQSTILAASQYSVATVSPTLAFEFLEQTGTTAYDTGTGGAGRTVTLNANTAWSAPSSVEFLNATHSGLVVSGTDIICPPNQPWTIEALVWLDAFTDSYPAIMRFKSGNANNPFVVGLSNQPSYYGVIFGSNSTFAKGKTGTTVADANALVGAWKKISVAYIGSNPTVLSSFRVKIDDVEKTLSSASGFATDTDISVLGSGGGSSTQWDGKIDYIRKYDQFL